MKSTIVNRTTETSRSRMLGLFTHPTLIVSLVLVLFAASASASPLVYVVTASQQFGTVDLATGKFNPIGNGTPDALSNLVWWKNRTLLTLIASGSSIGSLAKINPVTGEETVIGQTGLGFNAFDLGEVGGKLYLTDFSNNIYSVDPETGIATAIGATGMPPDPTIPFTFNSDGTFNLCDEGLYGIAGKLYATFDSYAIDPNQTPPTRAHEYVSPRVYEVDPFTGATRIVANTDWQLSAIVEVDGRAYAFIAVIDGFDFNFNFPVVHAEVVTLDLKTGKTNKIADIDPNLGPIFGAAPNARASSMITVAWTGRN
jgi:hypothetical protein